MPRGLDHIVHAVRDLDAAADLYRRLGFIVGARNKHPWGTHNHIIQFPGCFIELLTFAEPDKLGTDGLSTLFAAYNRDFIARGEGLSMLILESKDAQADEAGFRDAHIAASQGLRFEREGKRPDGTPVKVGFSLAFAEDKHAPDIHFATCQQHYPENFWNPAFQQHANGVVGVDEVLMVAEEPAAHRDLLQHLTGVEPFANGQGYSFHLPRGALSVFSVPDFVNSFMVKTMWGKWVDPPGPVRGARLVGLRFQVKNAERAWRVEHKEAMGALMVFTPEYGRAG